MRSQNLSTTALALSLVTLGSSLAAAQPLLTLKDPQREATVVVGLLSQPTVAWEKVGDADGSGSVYVRRLRIIGAGNITRKLKFFLDSDTPNLGREMSGVRQHVTYLQDLVVTYAFKDEIQVEGGLLLVPESYNSLQSAASLLTVGYGPYSFVSSAPTTSKIGRDQGVQLRGYLAGKHLEYRVAALRGIREIDPHAAVRTAARVAWHVFEPQTGLFYAGTTQGQKKLLVLGASVDRQDGYGSSAVDAFYERPVRDRDALTCQLDVIHYDGGATLRQLPRQNTWLLETGYTWGRRRLGAFAQAAGQHLAGGTRTTHWQVGGAWWLRGHRANLKAGVGRVTRGGSSTSTQVSLQTQVFAF